MVPFAGRVRHGVLDFGGTRTQLPHGLGTHAIHGFGYTSHWTQTGENEISFDFSDPWPYRGTAIQIFNVDEDTIQITMRVNAQDRQPVSLGWHPWFRRDIGTGTPLDLHFHADTMYERDPEGLPTGRTVPTSAGPWDDCFTDIRSGPDLRWGDLRVRLESSADHWVIYDEPDHTVCVEPQTGPPNEVNDNPRVIEAGESFEVDFTLTWFHQPMP